MPKNFLIRYINANSSASNNDNNRSRSQQYTWCGFSCDIDKLFTYLAKL